jgi:Tfp pilus assembly protein PilN
MTMTAKLISAVAFRPRRVEWAFPPKPAEGPGATGPLTGGADLATADAASTLEALQADREGWVADLKARCARLPGRVTLGIPASWTLLRVVELPSGSPEELRGMVELQVDKFSPFPVEESTLSHEILHEHDGRCRLVLSAARTDMLDRIGGALRDAGIRPHWVDLNVLGWWQLLVDAGKIHAVGSQVIVLQDAEACDLVVTAAGIPVAFRSLSGLEGLPQEERDDELFRETLYTLSSMEVGRAAESMVEISLWRRGEPPAALVARFAEHFGDIAKPYALETLPSLAEGLWRRAERRTPAMLNLAPRAWLATEYTLRARRRLLTAAIAIAGAWLTGMAVLFGGLQLGKQKLASLDRELTALKAPAEKVRALRDRSLALGQYMERSRSALECLREVSDLLPPGIDLKSFNYHKGKTLELSGEAEAYALVADFKRELEKSELFVSTELSRTHRTQQGKEVFKITATLPGGEKQ